MECNLSGILYPQLHTITKEALMHPVECLGDDDTQEAIERFLTFSFSSCSKAVMDPKSGTIFGRKFPIEMYLERFDRNSVKVLEENYNNENFKRAIVKLDNLSYKINKNNYFLTVTLEGIKNPGWSIMVQTTPDRFADLLFEFDSLHGWLMDSYKYYVDLIHKQKMIEQIEAVTKAAKSSRRRWW